MVRNDGRMEVVDDAAVGADVVADHCLASFLPDHLDCTLDEDDDTCPVVDDDDMLDDHLHQDKVTLHHREVEEGDEDDGHGVGVDYQAAQILHCEACHHNNRPMASRAYALDVDDHLVVEPRLEGTAMMMTGHHSG